MDFHTLEAERVIMFSVCKTFNSAHGDGSKTPLGGSEYQNMNIIIFRQSEPP
jgi:hypothetical protein